MNERTIQHDYVMKFICGREEDGGLGYRETGNNVVSNDLFIPAHLAEFISNSEPEVWRRLLSLYKSDEQALLTDLKEEIKARYLDSQNAATFFNKNREINFGGERVPLYYVSGTELREDEDFKKNIFAAVEESSHTVLHNNSKLYTVRPDVTFYLNGIYLGYMELKSVIMGQSASEHGRQKVAKDYLSTIKAYASVEGENEDASKVKRAVHAIFEKAIHLTASDINETYVIRNIASLYDFAHTKLAGATPVSVDEVCPEVIKMFKQYPITSHTLSEKERFEQVARALYSKKMIEKEILYYNFLEYRFERSSNGKMRASHYARLISPRPKQKFGCDKIMARIIEMLNHEKEPNYYMEKLRRELVALDIPPKKVEEIILRREQYCNNKFVYSLLMQYAAGFGKSNIIGWTALQLKDFRYEGQYAYDKIMLVVDRLQLRDQLDTTMRNMNIDKSMFIEATDKKTFIDALDSPKRIIVVNIQKFLDLQDAINESGRKLQNMRVAFLIDEIHRSNTGETNKEMINLFEQLQDSFKNKDGEVVTKKNLLIGFTATPSEETLARFGEFKSAQIVPLWVPFDSYTMKEAIEDGYILDPTENIFPYAVPVMFGSEDLPDIIDEKDPVKIKHSKEKVYAYEPRMRKIAEFIVDRLVSLVYGKIRGEGKAMLAVSSIPNAIKYTHIIREVFAEKCKQKPFDKYVDSPICIVYSDSQKYESCASMNFGKGESQVIQEFKSAKNGLIIVVDKLQTGFDEPKLHTLFLDKEISDINAIQTISRVNRTCKNKSECHVIDCSWKNVNVKNIKEAFLKFCDMVVSNFNPEEQAALIAKRYKELCKADLYKNWFDSFKVKSEDVDFILSMESAFRKWILQCIEREEAIKRMNAENGWTEGDPEYKTPENDAKELRATIGQYSTAIESVKNIYDIADKYTEERFIKFWQIYCHVFKNATRKSGNDDDTYVVEPIDIDESGFTLVDSEADETPTVKKPGPIKRKKEPKTKTLADVIKLIKKLNEAEEISLQCVQEWLKEIGIFFSALKDDEELCKYLSDDGFNDADKIARFQTALRKYCRTKLRKRTDVTDVDRLIELLKNSEDQLRAAFIESIRNTTLEPDYDYDTTEIVNPVSTDDLIAQIEQLFNPEYDEEKIVNKLVEMFASQFATVITKHGNDFKKVVETFFRIILAETLEDLDGLNESVPDNINRYIFAKNSAAGLKNIFKSLLLDLEPFIRKICYLKDGKLFGEYDGFISVVKELRQLNDLYFTNDPDLAQFKSFYNIIYSWRNDNAHKAPKLQDDQVGTAIYMVLCIYLYATMVSMSAVRYSLGPVKKPTFKATSDTKPNIVIVNYTAPYDSFSRRDSIQLEIDINNRTLKSTGWRGEKGPLSSAEEQVYLDFFCNTQNLIDFFDDRKAYNTDLDTRFVHARQYTLSIMWNSRYKSISVGKPIPFMHPFNSYGHFVVKK